MVSGIHRWVGLILLVVFAEAGGAEEYLAIGTILAAPESYAQHMVTVRGKVRVIREPEDSECSRTHCGPGIVAYLFILDDDTGAMDISVPCACVGHPSLAEGHTITATVRIRVLRQRAGVPVVIGVAHQIQLGDL